MYQRFPVSALRSVLDTSNINFDLDIDLHLPACTSIAPKRVLSLHKRKYVNWLPEPTSRSPDRVIIPQHRASISESSSDSN